MTFLFLHLLISPRRLRYRVHDQLEDLEVLHMNPETKKKISIFQRGRQFNMRSPLRTATDIFLVLRN